MVAIGINNILKSSVFNLDERSNPGGYSSDFLVRPRGVSSVLDLEIVTLFQPKIM